MDLDLLNKTVFITGVSSGIGAAAARLFAGEGTDVIIPYGRNALGAEQAAQGVRAAGRRAWLCPMDVSDPHNVTETLGKLPPEINGLDALVLCAGLSLHTEFTEIAAGEWQRVLDVNLNGAFYVLQALTPRLRQGSAVVLVSSVSAQTGVSHQAHYAAAKAGLVNLAKSAARALAPGVRVNCVTPGLTLTPMGQETIAALDPDYPRQKMLLQRYANLANSFMTGATVDVNGGRELR